MYCRYCGKQIEGDSLFCRHCGENIGFFDELKQESSSFISKIIRQFQKSNLKTQIILTVYLVYLLILICCWAYGELYGGDFLLCGIVIPIVLLCIHYFGRVWWLGRKEKQAHFHSPQEGKKVVVDEISKCVPLESENQSERNCIRVPLKTEMLLSFAKSHGKMHVVKQMDEVTGQAEHYCIFESEEESIKVDFTEDLGVLTADEISRRKYELCVNFYDKGEYELAAINNKKVEI